MSSDDAKRPDLAAGAGHAGTMIAEAVANHRRRTGEPPRASQTPAGTTGTLATGTGTGASPPTVVAPMPRGFALFCGVIYPALVILIEATTRYCAKNLFDPMPTWWHTALLAAVPIANLIAWVTLYRQSNEAPRLVAAANGAAVGVAAFYALAFLPIMPLAVIAILIGLGLLPLAPAFSLWASLSLTGALKSRHPAGHRFAKPFAAGLGIALCGIVATDVPLIVTRHGVSLAMSNDTTERERGIALLRRFGSRDLLLQMGQGHVRQAVGPLAFLMSWEGVFNGRLPRNGHVPHLAAREVHYRVTGEPFSMPARNATPAALAAMRTFDRDLGGTAVGATVPGLTLASSRIDGSIAANDAAAYIEWVFEVTNATSALQEARMTLALPPGGVVARVTLWVNGVEEEAAFAGRAQVRAAYERVVRRSQDPFLVTTGGADRVLAQAFPVPPNGGTMTFKVGITAPLEFENADGAKARLVMPAIIDRNFGFGEGLRHSVWIESKRPLATATVGLHAAPLGAGTRLVGEVSDTSLARTRPVILVERDASHRIAQAANPETGAAMQEIMALPVAAADTLMLVVDGSMSAGPHVKPILAALAALPDGLRVGLVFAGETTRSLAPTPWSPQHKAAIASLLASGDYVGGVDNTEPLITAVSNAGRGERTHVLWIHGPQPVRFASTKVRLEQAAARVARAPQLSLYALVPGPNQLLIDAPWTIDARDIPNTGDVTADLTRALRRIAGVDPVPAVRRTLLAGAYPDQASEPHLPPPVATVPKGSEHLVRLAAHEEVLRLVRSGKPAHRDAAVQLAGAHRLVTPVSGAVVLETKRQYQEAGLTQGHKGQAGNVPTVPEPHEWALILMAAAALGWFLLKGRNGPAGDMAGAA